MFETAISTAPMRLSIAGGGTDLPEYFESEPAKVVSVAIDRRVAVAASEDAGSAARACRLAIPTAVYLTDFGPGAYDPYYTAACGILGIPEETAVSVASEVRPGSGLGGSGAFGVALLDALSRHSGSTKAPHELAELAFLLERECLGRPIGKQDSWIAALGGAVELSIDTVGRVTTKSRPEIFTKLNRLLESELLIFRLPGARSAGRVLSGARPLTEADREKAKRMGLANERAFLSGDRTKIGEVLRRHWQEKIRRNPSADHILCQWMTKYSEEMGILGFKLIGAGGGGHLMLVTGSSARSSVISALSNKGLVHEPIRLDDVGLVRWTEVADLKTEGVKLSCV